MNPFFKIFALIVLVIGSQAQAEKLTAERIFSEPSLSGQSMRSVKISPDGKRITYLKGKENDYQRYDLWQYNIALGTNHLLVDSDDLSSGVERLSDEEKARRERKRLSGSGIVSYRWSEDGSMLLFPLEGDIYIYSLSDKKSTKIVTTEAFETDVRFSPMGNYVSYVRDYNLYLYSLKNKTETAITTKGDTDIKFATAEFVAQEEMSRMTGYWWSPDESKIAFTKIDETPVELVIRSEIYADSIKTIEQRYPFAGKANVTVELAIQEIASKKRKWVKLGKNKDIYLPRVQWSNNSNQLSYQLQSRNQQKLSLNIVSWPSMRSKTLLREKSATWINLHKDLAFIGNQGQFVWASEKDGFKHLYLYDKKGQLQTQLTQGSWVVDRIEAIDEKNNQIYFTGRKDSVLEKHLYVVPLSGGEIKRISERSGFHNIMFGENAQVYIDSFSSIKSPKKVSLHDQQGKRLTWLLQNQVDDKHPLKPYLLDWVTPEFSTIQSRDGVSLHYKLYKPAGFNLAKKYPVIVYLYGGPGVQMVANKWDRIFPQYMAQQGYAVFTLDNRGSKYRGKAFEEALYQKMGSVEVRDQEDGVKYLHSLPWVDKAKIGVHGHSYGGYMTLMTMFKAPELFKAGVSGAPVTDWALYDTHYTERYMGNPMKDPEAYQASSVFPHALNSQNPLLIYHGMADDNVLFKHSSKLYHLLQENNLPFMVMDYPGKKHSIRGKKTQMHRLNMIRQFFDLHFGVSRN